ncbi:MAG TPA: glutamate-cysteine ligase family protein [Candidatus Solibacter sp.]|jgi:glutamate--cysteine ligase|nr:glutamate-cysteine ligase family protein [Candidatus Solibacter sp.]
MLTASRLTPPDVRRQVAELFTDTTRDPSDGPGRVGLELEWIPARPSQNPPGTVGVEALRTVLDSAPALVEEARVTYEPGGQLEISPPPAPSPALALEMAAAYGTRLRRLVAPAGIRLLSSGMNPWHSVDQLGLQTPGPRYVTQQAHYDAIGPAGRQMMRQTAAMQINLDLGAPGTWADRWRLANLAGPSLAAAFANSPVAAGKATGVPGTRCLTWQSVDPSRTGYDGRQVGPEPEAAYARFARQAEFMALPRNGETPAAVRESFAEWMERGGPRPDRDDLTHHLSTLFPPVRPRGHYEVRYVDMLPPEWLPVPVTLLAALLYDRTATLSALDLLDAQPLDLAIWRRSATRAMQDEALRVAALGLFDIAMRAVRRMPGGYLPDGAESLLTLYRERFPEQHRCPADDQLDRYQIDPEDLSIWN